MKDLPLSKVYQLLEPGPVVLLTTARKGYSNVMAMSWHMMVEFEPPLVACVVSSANYSFAALRATKKCVIAVPALELAAKVVEVGNCSGRDVQKFEKFGLTPAPAERVAPPPVVECFANLECKVADTHQPVQLGQLIESVAQTRFFQPEAVQTLEFPGGLQRAMEIPHHARLPRAEGLRLVGVHHDLHVVAHCFAHRFDQAHVFL